MYLSEAEILDKEMNESWKEGMNGIVIFSCLFSVTVATFIMESSELLSSDSDDVIRASFTHILHQLFNETYLQNVVIQSDVPFRPTASAIRINVMWLLSLAFSLSCALLGTSTQLLSRQFQKHSGATHKYAYAHLSHGVKMSRQSGSIQAITTLLYLSVFLFIAGLIDFLLSINKTVAYCIIGYVSVFSFVFIRQVGGLLRESIWELAPLRATGLSISLTTRSNSSEGHTHTGKQQQWHAYGARWSVGLGATASPWIMDASKLGEAVSVLDQNHGFEDFVERIPGLFEPSAVPGASSAILSCMDVPPNQSPPDPILGSRIHDLLGTCVPDTSPLAEEPHRNRLRTCLKSLWYCGRAYNRLGNSATLPDYVRVAFASPEMTQLIQNEQDLAARVTGRCFASLVAKKLSSDVNARSCSDHRFSDAAEVACLSAILGTSSDETIDWVEQPGAIGLANINSLLSGEIDTLLDDDKLPRDVLQIMQETLVILATELLHLDTNTSTELPLELVARFHGVHSNVVNARTPEWLRVLLNQVSEKLPI
ncbi:hypothetical protein BC827DRAFT_522558 [Russula dissimulans]|nr:hypothetical protein BC827DRAFT_522558 [Russula dissimulans]